MGVLPKASSDKERWAMMRWCLFGLSRRAVDLEYVFLTDSCGDMTDTMVSVVVAAGANAWVMAGAKRTFPVPDVRHAAAVFAFVAVVDDDDVVNERDSSLFIFGGYQVAWHVDSGRFRAWGGGRRSEVGGRFDVACSTEIRAFGSKKMVGER
jgi:hypothetical protein